MDQQIITEVMSQMSVDHVPFHDLYRSIFGFDKPRPNEQELLETINLAEELLTNHDVVVLKGPEMKRISDSNAECIHWLKSNITTEHYENWNYGIWFDLDQNA